MSLAVSNHAMWAINSACHRKQSDQDSCHATDLFWLGIVNGGEGFHAAHHDAPGCAKHGRRMWYNLDLSYVVILGLEVVGLVWNVQHPGEPDTRRPKPQASGLPPVAAPSLGTYQY